MEREDRPAPAWVGDVSAGVDAWTRGDRGDRGGRRSRRERPPAPPPDRKADGPDADPESVARTILLNALTGQARSRKELRDKLAKKDVPDELAERLLDRFGEVGLVNDEAFARSWVESRQRSRGLARRALAQELRRKGVDDETARTALDELEPEQEEQAARALVARKARSMASLDRTTATRRLVGMLARKGYPQGLAFRVVRDELGELDADS